MAAQLREFYALCSEFERQRRYTLVAFVCHIGSPGRKVKRCTPQARDCKPVKAAEAVSAVHFVRGGAECAMQL